MRNKTLLALILAGSLVAAACSTSAPKPDEATTETTSGEAAATERGIPAFAPLAFRDGEPEVTDLGQTDDTRAFRVGDVMVIHKQTPANSVVAAQLYLVGGSANLTDATAGIEQLALNVAVGGGTESTTKDELNARLDAVGSSIGTFVDRDYSGYGLQSVVDHFDMTWELFVETVFEPAMPAAEIELRRARHLAEIKRLFDDPDRQVGYTATRLLFQDHPYYNFQIGTPENVEAFTREELRAYQRSLVKPERMLLVVVGNLDHDTVVDRVKSSFGRLAPTGTEPPVVGPIRVDHASLEVEARELPTNYIFGLYPAPKPGDEDYAAMLVATDYLRDRLFEEVRTRRNLTYAVSAGLSNKRANYGVLYVTAVDPGQTIPVIFDEIERLKSTPLTEQDLDEVRNVFLTGHYMGQQTNSSQASSLAQAQIIGGDWRQVETFLEDVRAVDPADIQRVANRYFTNYHFGVVGTPEAVPGELFGVE